MHNNININAHRYRKSGILSYFRQKPIGKRVERPLELEKLGEVE